MKMTVKKGDNVVVIAGKEKGKTGKVLEVFPKNNRVLVDGVNLVTKHKKARTQQEKSAIIKKTAPIDASNVMVVCAVCGKATRIAHKEIDGKKVRVCKKCSASLDKEYVKQTKKEAKKNVASEKKEPAKKTTAKTEKTVEKAEVKKTTTKKTTEKKVETKKETAVKEPAKKTTKSAETKTAKTQKSKTKKTSKSEG